MSQAWEQTVAASAKTTRCMLESVVMETMSYTSVDYRNYIVDS